MKYPVAAAVAAIPLILSAALPVSAATLTTGSGDGGVTVEVDELGQSSQAIFNPVGAIDAANTFFNSYVAVRQGSGRVQIGNTGAEPVQVLEQSDTVYVTEFSYTAMRVRLRQSLSDSFENGVRVGSALTQQYTFFNDGVQTNFDLVRYLDADLDFDGDLQDGGGILGSGGNRILYEVEANAGAQTDTTFVGITSSVSGNNTNSTAARYEMAPYSGLQSRVLAGNDLANDIFGDNDSDGFIDGTYDVTMALQNFVTVPQGQSFTYTTTTIFGNAVPPSPGSTEALPLLPDQVSPDGGFVFQLAEVDPDSTIWIDPEIAVGYTYEIEGDSFDAVTLPSFATVPDADYIVSVNGVDIDATSGETIAFATPVTSFSISGIDEALMLDPDNPLAFVTGISVVGGLGQFSVTQTPTVVDTDPTDPAPVPLPASGLLLGFAFAGLAAARRVRK